MDIATTTSRLTRPMRDTSTATWSVQELPGFRRRVTIDHQPLAGVTPTMLDWWFRNIGGDMTVDGERVARYLVWHPRDHIRWELARPAPGGGAGEGARFRIVEMFAARREYYIDTTETVEKLDPTGIRLARRMLGVPVARLEHYWSACHDHAHYVSVLDIGARARLFRPVNAILTRRVFPADMAHAWLRHNVEEVGRLEQFLPALYAEQMAVGR
jgi:hypothetical protein